MACSLTASSSASPNSSAPADRFPTPHPPLSAAIAWKTISATHEGGPTRPDQTAQAVDLVFPPVEVDARMSRRLLGSPSPSPHLHQAGERIGVERTLCAGRDQREPMLPGGKEVEVRA